MSCDLFFIDNERQIIRISLGIHSSIEINKIKEELKIVYVNTN